MNELMSHPSIDGAHSPQPYLPREPEEILHSGEYNTEVDVIIGNQQKLVLRYKVWATLLKMSSCVRVQ